MKNMFKIMLVLALCLVLVPVGFAQSGLEGFDVGMTGSLGFVNGAFIDGAPVGASFVIGTPFGYKVGRFDLTFSAALGAYSAKRTNGDSYTPFVIGVGANATVAQMVFAESHLGLVGSGLGVRGFAGVSLEKLMKKSLNLPVNILIGGEGFISMKPASDSDNSSYWGGLGVRVDYSF